MRFAYPACPPVCQLALKMLIVATRVGAALVRDGQKRIVGVRSEGGT